MPDSSLSADGHVLPRCFVIRPFDAGKFDRRYVETVRPALEKAGVEPVCANEVVDLRGEAIHKIERELLVADICVAEVTDNNPNVWFEVGFALASMKPIVLLAERSARPDKFPFNTQGRHWILYDPDYRSGYDELERELISTVRSEIDVMRNIRKQAIKLAVEDQSSRSIDNKKDYEVVVLAVLLANIHRRVGLGLGELLSDRHVRSFPEPFAALGLQNLLDDGLASRREVEMEDDNSPTGTSMQSRFVLEPNGIAWARLNEERIASIFVADQSAITGDTPDDDVPF